jgi:hypothetical protein
LVLRPLAVRLWRGHAWTAHRELLPNHKSSAFGI